MYRIVQAFKIDCSYPSCNTAQNKGNADKVSPFTIMVWKTAILFLYRKREYLEAYLLGNGISRHVLAV